MNQKVSLQQIVPILLALLLLGTLGLLSQSITVPPAIPAISELSGSRAGTSSVKAFDAEQAANISAARWLAMARFYEEQGLLTRDNFNYE
jgi:uncharacterized lipoprotein YajG